MNIIQQVAASIGTALFSVLLTNGIKAARLGCSVAATLEDQPASSPRSWQAGLARRTSALQARALATWPTRSLRVRRRHDPGRLLPDPGVVPAAQGAAEPVDPTAMVGH